MIVSKGQCVSSPTKRGRGGTSLHELYRNLRPQRVRSFSHVSKKFDVNFGLFGLK